MWLILICRIPWLFHARDDRRETPVAGDPSLLGVGCRRNWAAARHSNQTSLVLCSHLAPTLTRWLFCLTGESWYHEAALMELNVIIASGDFAHARQRETSSPLLSLTRKVALAVCRSCITFSAAKVVRAAAQQGRAAVDLKKSTKF